MRRALALLLLIIGLAPGTWWRVKPLPRPGNDPAELRFVELKVPPAEKLAAELGPFKLEKVWRLESRNRDFGGYSALLPLGGGELLAFSDNGSTLRFSPPGPDLSKPAIQNVFSPETAPGMGRDVESATADPAFAVVWVGMESKNAIVRLAPKGGQLRIDAQVRPVSMAGWGNNSGPETLVRLKDGRFLTIREGFADVFGRSLHAAVVFPSDPVESEDGERFTLAGPKGFSPTDMAQLPDGRVLVLFRRLDWPFPVRFSIRLAIGDPATIRPDGIWHVREVARLPESLPVDNFEGLATEPRKDGELTVWLISDDNRAVYQASYLWRLSLDPADLPRTRKKARGNSARLLKKPD